MKAFERWKAGLAILFRLFFLSIIFGLITLPIRVIEFLPEEVHGFGSICGLIYLVIVLPLALPIALETCGLQVSRTGSFDQGGTMNAAAKAKLEQLRLEGEARRTNNGRTGK